NSKPRADSRPCRRVAFVSEAAWPRWVSRTSGCRGLRPSWPREIDSLWLLQIYALNYFTGLAKGEIASLAGAADDPRYFQINLPVQPGRWSSSFSLFVRRGTRLSVS